MTREEILEVAQKQTENYGEYERTVTRKSLKLGMTVAILIWVIMIVLEYCIFRKPDFGKATLVLIIAGLSNSFEGKKLKKMKQLVCGIVEIILAVLFFFIYLGALYL